MAERATLAAVIATDEGACGVGAVTSLVVDTDTASDDAVALLLAARTPGVTLRAVTTVAGNVPLELATRNALVTLELVGAGHVAVSAGLPGPLVRPLETAQFVHGDDGMGDAELPAPTATPTGEHAVDTLRRLARDEPGRHALVTLGPLSNVATAVVLDPLLLTHFRHTYLMAGAFDGVGNVTADGEYNVWADPEAAHLVVAAPGPKTFVGWDVSRRFAVMTPTDQDALRACGQLGEFAVDINRCVDVYAREVSGLAGFDLPDPIAMAVALDPSIVGRTSDHRITVGRQQNDRGSTRVADPGDDDTCVAAIAWEVDERRFKAMLIAACTEVPRE